MVRLLLVDDDAIVRRLLGGNLAPFGIEVVAEATDGDEVVPAVQAHHPDVVLMDLRMRRVDGIRATEAVRRLPDPPGVVALTSLDTDDVVLRAVRAGAAGFIDKTAATEEIADAIHQVAAGQGAFGPRAARVVAHHVAQDPDARQREDALRRLEVLTDKEREVAAQVATGAANAEIAGRTFLSETTVKTHLTRALTKLGLANRTELAVLVARAGTGPG
ncbi:response regulator transcription factor [Cellulomonas bogoriensis]|uniref:LuxR family transcriptional regulator n=1 Tax=Cellulomonas bogoriensis 69B4 = DSM 16987 TaxID=1386082 RepID=A0A0A0C328_9CELL|nr:response regulator transcription factor [Cellulomonas bogoriensis]KGM14422.1 LuxR family transcriptional regulator [Cellulomonas bogoriensis 69B4 = DSM 16987]